MSAASASTRPEIRALTSLRFFAALLVFVHHIVNVELLSKYPGVAQADLPLRVEVLRQGHVGVTFFFVLSGFVLAYVYQGRLYERPVRAVGRFYVARIGRIYPLHLITFLLFIPAAVIGTDTATKTLVVGALANLTLTQAFIPLGGDTGVPVSYNGVAWSLSAEMFFYLLFPAALFVLDRVYEGRRRPLFIVSLSLWLLITGAAIAFQHAPISAWIFGQLPVVHLVSFVIGVCLGLRFLHTASSRSGSPHLGLWSIYEASAVALLAGSVAVSLMLPMSVRYSAAILPATVLVIAVFSRQAGLISRCLQWSPLVYLGETSFGFYMVHFGVIVVAYRAGLFGAMPIPALVGGLLCVSILLAAASFAWIEQPLRRRVRGAGNAWVDDLEQRLTAQREREQSSAQTDRAA